MMAYRFYQPGYMVYRPSAGQDAYGGVATTYSTHLAVRGRLRPLSGDQRLSADRQTEFATHRFYCNPADIQPGDEIRKDGDRYLVKFASDVMTMGRLMQVDVELQ